MCSYCGCHELTFIGRLAAEHDAIIEASGDLRRSVLGGDLVDLASAGSALSALLDPHTNGEESGLFAELSLLDEFVEPVASLCAEHLDLDDDLRGIVGGDPTRVDRFIARLRSHIDREENGLFPAAAIALDPDAMERLGTLARATGRRT